MFHQRVKSVFLIVVMLGGMSSAAMATMEASEKNVGVRKLGVSWDIAEDRKMENNAGVYAPEGLDKYMKRYFDRISEKVDRISAKLENLSAQVTALGAAVAKKSNPEASSLGKLV